MTTPPLMMSIDVVTEFIVEGDDAALRVVDDEKELQPQMFLDLTLN
jgi:hypothetical protein